MEQSPLVSIICTAYNHESFIKEALDGFVMQKTDFPFEIIISDDASTDLTAEIIKQYEKKYPKLFKTFYHKENQYSKYIPFFCNELIPNAQGKYIALCEGDDYWTDPLKLQKQVDFLEANEDFAICFHNVKILKDKEHELVDDFMTRDVSDVTDIYELAKENYIHTLSVVFRKNGKVISDFRELGKLSAGDYPLHMLNAKYGKIKKFSECMGVYRFGNGIWSGSEDIEFKNSTWLDLLDKLCNYFVGDQLLVNNLKEQYGCNAYTLYDYFRNIDDTKSKKYLLLSIENNFNYLIGRMKESNETILNLTKDINSIRLSKAYRLGKILLKPVSLFKK